LFLGKGQTPFGQSLLGVVGAGVTDLIGPIEIVPDAAVIAFILFVEIAFEAVIEDIYIHTIFFILNNLRSIPVQF
jgi:hypothetical protein